MMLSVSLEGLVDFRRDDSVRMVENSFEEGERDRGCSSGEVSISMNSVLMEVDVMVGVLRGLVVLLVFIVGIGFYIV